MNTLQTIDSGATAGVRYSMSLYAEYTDEELLRLSLSEPRAFELLLVRHQKEFLSRAQAVVKSRDEAEDVVQEAFVRIYRFAPKFNKASGSFRAWSITILMNVARTKYQKKVKERSVFADLEDKHYENLGDDRVHQHYLDADAARRALSKVDAETAEILSLAYLEDLPYEVIAERKGISVGAVKARVHRAKLAVRNALASS